MPSLDRLKLNTIVGGKRCLPWAANVAPRCKGKYPNSFGRYVLEKDVYNTQHPEKCYPQIKARRKVLGNINSFLC